MDESERAGGRHRGFRVVDMMAAVAVLAVAMAVAIPAIRSAREAARGAECRGRLKQLALGLHLYNSAWSAFPPGYASGAAGGGETGPGWAWGTFTLPYLSQTALYAGVNFELPVHAPGSMTARSTALAVFLCPSEFRPGPASFHAGRGVAGLPADLAASQYVGCGGARSGQGRASDEVDGIFARDASRRISDVIDGTSNTLMVGERSRTLADAAWSGVVPDGLVPGARHGTDPSWPSPSVGGTFATVLGYAHRPSGDPDPVIGLNSNRAGHDAFRGIHPGGVNFAIGDGSVRFVRESIDPRVFGAMATHRSGEVPYSHSY